MSFIWRPLTARTTRYQMSNYKVVQHSIPDKCFFFRLQISSQIKKARKKPNKKSTLFSSSHLLARERQCIMYKYRIKTTQNRKWQLVLFLNFPVKFQISPFAQTLQQKTRGKYIPAESHLQMIFDNCSDVLRSRAFVQV